MKLYVIKESVQQRDNMLIGYLGLEDGTQAFYEGKPVVFNLDMNTMMDIFIPESLEPIYPLIEDAVMRGFVTGE